MSGSKKMNRRNFLTTGVTSAVAVAAGSAGASSLQKKMDSPRDKTVSDLPYNPRTHKVMPTRNLGKTGYQVGIFSLGGQATVEIEGKEPKPAELRNLIQHARKRGLKVIFAQPQFSVKSAQIIANAIGGQVVFADSLAPDWHDNLKKTAIKFNAALQ